MNVNAFRGDTYLTRTQECAHSDFGCNFVDIDVREDDTGVITAKLEIVSKKEIQKNKHLVVDLPLT